MRLKTWRNKKAFTIGVELETRLQNKTTLQMTNEAKWLKEKAPKKLEPFLHEEFAKSLLEIVTPICKTPKEATDFLRKTVIKLNKIAHKKDISLVATGTYPNTHEPLHVINNARYAEIKDEYATLLDDFSACGLHIHIGFQSSAKAIKAYNGLINYSPIFICLLANSPFFKGKDTGLLSYRLSIFDRLSRSGIPAYFKTYKYMQKAYEEFFRSNTIKTIADIWWDLRVNPSFGTLELRIGDSVHEMDRVRVAVALFQALSLYLQDKKPIFLQTNTLAQNRWNAIRHGWDGNFYENKNYTFKEFTQSLVQKMKKEGVFKKLGTTKEANMLLYLTEKPNLAQIQRDIYNQTKDIKNITSFGTLL